MLISICVIAMTADKDEQHLKRIQYQGVETAVYVNFDISSSIAFLRLPASSALRSFRRKSMGDPFSNAIKIKKDFSDLIVRSLKRAKLICTRPLASLRASIRTFPVALSRLSLTMLMPWSTKSVFSSSDSPSLAFLFSFFHNFARAS